MQADGTTSAVLRSVGLTEDRTARCVPLTGGTFNTVSRVTPTDGGGDWVVKTPPPATPGTLMGYEQDLLVNEVTFYTAAEGSAPVPRVLYSELDPAAPTGPYLVMSACPGRSWSEFAPGSLSAAEERGLRKDLGRSVARLHAVTNPAGFGYPSLSVGRLDPSWRQAFTAMTDAVLADADTYRARLPRPTAAVRDLLAAASPVLDDITRPALVHFDLWQGNLLVDGGPGARTIGGIVDGERMFWGDPVADFVSLALFGDVAEDPDFLAGYAEGSGRPVVFDASVRLRLALYRCYLYLIMLVETVPRRASREDREWAWTHVAPQLESALADVESALRTGE
ncbi:phosphotransferase family protein [Streptomyces sp. NPDC088170]|uniref:phosphotransferase family protein n=1 Tax=Streptomyces sp. NPDC088170 TaxID=3365834 RepID=UPI00380946C5